ncbi:hypothetical protein MDA_GLEAN10007682 [Myotis davidii]|uniref:Uncharacterized protein n=1 Tax=Myotis davidii TaxID=225400 RepID=L5LFA5_MYODS|nr:hypothetical protein MDA_GLEAN10007682 [Myotis davidii]
MVGVSRSGMMVVSRGARPRQGASRCHRDEPLVVTENSLLPCAVVLPSAQPAAGTGPTHTRCQRQSHHLHRQCWPQLLSTISGCEWQLPAPDNPSRLLHLLLFLRGDRGR